MAAVTIHSVETKQAPKDYKVTVPDFEKEYFEDVGFLTSMLIILMGNYSQTGHFGGPLAYTPYNVCLHLAGPKNGGLSYDIRNPKHPFSDKYLLAGGHCIPTNYSLWMVLYEAMLRQAQVSGDAKFKFDPNVAILSIDALGFRRSHGALSTLLQKNGLQNDPLFSQAKLRGIRALAGHSENTDVTNDVNGGPSGVGVASSGGKATFWDFVGAPRSLKVMALEGEFAMTEGHAQELKTLALANQVGKRLRILMSFNNAGIDDSLIGGIIKEKYTGYDIPNQWASYGWNVFTLSNGNDYEQILAALKVMEEWPDNDGRPMIVVGKTVKGWWPTAQDGKIPGFGDQITGYPSHPYTFKMNSEYFLALCSTFEQKYGVQFSNIRNSVPGNEVERLKQFKTNIDIALSVLDKKPKLREWLANRLIDIANTVPNELPLRIDTKADPFRDSRLKPENLPVEPQQVTVKNPANGQEVKGTVKLFEKAGEKKGTRRAISEIIKWVNYVTGNRMLTIAADLSESINVEHGNFLGHYDPFTNPTGTRLKAPITEACNASTILGLISQNASKDPKKFAGVWGVSGTYGAFTPLMYTPVRVHSQQKQDSPFELGVITIIAGHSGPETAADARTHFGIFAPQVWTLFPRNRVVNLYFWDYNDVAPGYFAAVQAANAKRELGVIVIHVARPDMTVADRNTFADKDLKSAAKGAYVIRDYDAAKPKSGVLLVQGSSATVNLVKIIPRLEQAGINLKIVSVISEELFDLQPETYRNKVLSNAERYDCTVVTTMTKRVPPLKALGPLTEEYTLSADFDDGWRSGGTEPDVIAEARLDEESIFQGVKRFADDRVKRLARQREAFGLLS